MSAKSVSPLTAISIAACLIFMQGCATRNSTVPLIVDFQNGSNQTIRLESPDPSAPDNAPIYELNPGDMRQYPVGFVWFDVHYRNKGVIYCRGIDVRRSKYIVPYVLELPAEWVEWNLDEFPGNPLEKNVFTIGTIHWRGDSASYSISPRDQRGWPKR